MLNRQKQAWLVDLDGTLYRGFPVKLAMGFTLLGGGFLVWPQLEAFRKAHEDLRHHGTRCEQGPFRAQLEAAASASGKPIEEVEANVRRWMFEKPLPWLGRFARAALVEQLRGYRAEGGKLALVSDYPARDKLSAMGIADLFDVVVAQGESDELKYLKPNPQSFQLAAEKLGVLPEQCLVVGDRADADGQAAEAAGMSFHLVS